MNRRSFALSLFSLSLGAFIALSGCNNTAPPEKTNGGGAPEKTASAAEKPKIALIMKSLANEFFLTMQKGAEAHQAKNADKYALLSNGIKDELDIARQQQLVEQMIAQQVKAIVIAPADSKALISVCKKAIEAGITVVNIDNKFDSAVLKDQNIAIPFVGPDNRKGAKLVGDALAKTLKAGDGVAILEGAPAAFNAIQRKAGFEDAMKAANIAIVASQSANWETSQANKIASAILSSHPDIKAILCANDNMALGAIAATKAANKSGQIAIVGFDNISAIQRLVKEGEVLATADQHADQLAVFGIEYALDILAKKGTPADKETPVDLITKSALK